MLICEKCFSVTQNGFHKLMKKAQKQNPELFEDDIDEDNQKIDEYNRKVDEYNNKVE